MPNPKVRITKTINAITGKYPILSMLLKVNFKPNMATPIRSTVPEANSIPALQFFSLFKKLNAIPISNANSIQAHYIDLIKSLMKLLLAQQVQIHH